MVIRPSSLVGRHIGKTFEIDLNNLLFSQHICIVGCYYSVICFILLYRTFTNPYYSQSSSSEEGESSALTKKPTKPQHKAPQEPEHQESTDPVFYREVDLSDLPSQYAEEVETFRQILDLHDPRETLPRSSTTVLGLDAEKGQQELRPRGPSAMLPLNPILKDAFEKFEQDFLASNLPEGRYIKPPASTAKYYCLLL